MTFVFGFTPHFWSMCKQAHFLPMKNGIHPEGEGWIVPLVFPPFLVCMHTCTLFACEIRY